MPLGEVRFLYLRITWSSTSGYAGSIPHVIPPQGAQRDHTCKPQGAYRFSRQPTETTGADIGSDKAARAVGGPAGRFVGREYCRRMAANWSWHARNADTTSGSKCLPPPSTIMALAMSWPYASL